MNVKYTGLFGRKYYRVWKLAVIPPGNVRFLSLSKLRKFENCVLFLAELGANWDRKPTVTTLSTRQGTFSASGQVNLFGGLLSLVLFTLFFQRFFQRDENRRAVSTVTRKRITYRVKIGRQVKIYIWML